MGLESFSILSHKCCRVPKLGYSKPTIKRSKPLKNPRPENPIKDQVKAPPRRIRRSKPHMYEDGAPSTAFRLVRGSLDGKPRPRKFSYSHDPGSTRSTPLIHLLTDKAFNATTFTNAPTAPSAWEHHLCLILLFTAHPGMGDKK
jgi:hypothetical protein